MADPSVAGFDPIIFLHHANVDRMLSLWAAINPGVWVSPGIAEDGGSFTTPPGAPYDQTTALTPFWDNQTSFWASTAVTDTSKLGYTYPDFNGVDVTNTDATRTAISNRVNQLYGTSVFGSFAALPQSTIPAPATSGHTDTTAKKAAVASSSHILTRSLAPTEKVVVPALPSHNPAAPPQQHPSTIQVTDHHPQRHMNIHPHPTVVEQQSSAPPNHGMWDWTARIEFKKYELGTSFSVLIFLGQIPENPREWRISPNYVGGHHAFVNSAASSCANCSNQQDLVIEGFVHLNHAIVQHSGLGSLEPNVIKPYLTQNLHWKVQKSNGEEAELQSLEVAVIATPLSYPPGAIFPVPGQAHRHNGITHGKNGGSRHA
jgi:tyrosinase